MSLCQHCGQGAMVADAHGLVCPDCIEEGYYNEAKPERKEMKREATLSMTLNADSGYASSETHRISADQWERIVRIANEATS